MSISCVLLDLDGTLIDHKASLMRMGAEIAQRYADMLAEDCTPEAVAQVVYEVKDPGNRPPDVETAAIIERLHGELLPRSKILWGFGTGRCLAFQSQWSD